METSPAAPGLPLTADELERRLSSRLLDVLIRAALLAALAVLCYQIFAPFLTLAAWSIVLAVSMYPLHQRLARSLGGRQGRASTILILVSVLVILGPMALLLNSLGDSLRGLVQDVQHDSLKIPAPRDSVRNWPVVGEKIHAAWTRAAADLPGLVQSLQPKIADLVRKSLSVVANIGGGLLVFLSALIIAGIIMAYGGPGASVVRSLCIRIAGPERGTRIATLSTATIRTVAQGVLGVAFIQAMLIGLALLVARVPWAGLLSVIALVLAIAQVPTFLVTLPAIAYLWMSGHYGTVAAVGYTVILVVAGLIDNVLKPLMLGRGVDVPMPVILLGAVGGMAAEGILGMFLGAVLLALGYQLLTGWVSNAAPASPLSTPPS
ncbi:MAG TPA: AI-2E family transporter [Planctomycetota bacterium]|nr:AI-2E family transporter [Planctomycetota bacterium]